MGASKGHALLKKKADALTVRFRQILRKIIQIKEDMGTNMRTAFFALVEAKYAAGEFKSTVIENANQATAKVHLLGLGKGTVVLLVVRLPLGGA